MFEGAVERGTFFHLHRLVKRPLYIPKDGACYRRDAGKPSGVMKGEWWAEDFAVT